MNSWKMLWCLNFLKLGFFCFLVLFFSSCAREEVFTIKNNSSQILTLVSADKQVSKILQGFCFQFVAKKFPLQISFSSTNFESDSFILDEPSHYIVESSTNVISATKACISEDIQ